MVFEKIREIIAEQTGKDVEEITLETNVKEDLDADSLDFLKYHSDFLLYFILYILLAQLYASTILPTLCPKSFHRRIRSK